MSSSSAPPSPTLCSMFANCMPGFSTSNLNLKRCASPPVGGILRYFTTTTTAGNNNNNSGYDSRSDSNNNNTTAAETVKKPCEMVAAAAAVAGVWPAVKRAIAEQERAYAEDAAQYVDYGYDDYHRAASETAMTTEEVEVEEENEEDVFPSCIDVMKEQAGEILKAVLPRRCHEPTGPLMLLMDMMLGMFVSCGASRSSINRMPQYVVKRQATAQAQAQGEETGQAHYCEPEQQWQQQFESCESNSSNNDWCYNNNINNWCFNINSSRCYDDDNSNNNMEAASAQEEQQQAQPHCAYQQQQQQLEFYHPCAAEKCPICLGPYEDGETVRKLMCNHVFHSECVDAWLQKKSLCPVCKADHAFPSINTEQSCCTC